MMEDVPKIVLFVVALLVIIVVILMFAKTGKLNLESVKQSLNIFNFI